MQIVRLGIFFAVLGCALVPALFVNTLQAYLPLVFLVLISICSLVYSLLLMACFSMDDHLEGEEFTRLSPSEIGVKVRNRGILIFPRISAGLNVEGPNGYRKKIPVNITLAPREKSRIGMEFAFQHIDKYTVRINNVRIYGLLGVLGFIFSKRVERDFTVMPRLVDIDFDIAAEHQCEGAAISNVKTITDNSSYSGVRDYVAGDPLKRIHWKLSAHEQKHKTRLYDDDSSIALSVLIDATMPEGSGESLSYAYDCLVESALSITVSALAYKNKTLIVYRRLGEINQISPLTPDQAVTEVMGGVAFGENSGVADYLLGQNSGGLIVVCTCVLSDDLARNLVYLKSKGRNPILIYSPPRDRDILLDKKLTDLLSANLIEHYVVKEALELKSKMESKQ